MTQPIDTPAVPAGSGKVETKTSAAALGAYLGAFALLTVLSNVDTDLINKLPDALEVPVYALGPAVLAFGFSYLKSHRPAALSKSAVLAVVDRNRGTTR